MNSMVLENGLHNHCFLVLKNTNNQDYKQKKLHENYFSDSLFYKNILKIIYSTVTDLAKLRGWSTLQPLITAM